MAIAKSVGVSAALVSALVLLGGRPAEVRGADPRGKVQADVSDPGRLSSAKMLVSYFDVLSVPKPFLVRTGAELESRRRTVRDHVLACAGLLPLPERVSLDVRETRALDHPWCTVRRVYYRLWPGVVTSGLLWLPREPPGKPAPAVLAPHGHWSRGNAQPIVQTRCIVLAKLGYVVFSPTQLHHEDLAAGVSHQTLGIWSNLRAIDVLEGMDRVDRTRLGVCGESGGGLQTQMLCAVDDRIDAAVIVGMTCDWREILFPHAAHCGCNHFPGILRITDGPELSAVGCPLPVLYLSMDDWTRTFRERNFPEVLRLYDANAAGGRVACTYEPTEHTYDRSKREQTYRWFERWLRDQGAGPQPGSEPAPAAPVIAEPDRVETFPPEVLEGLTLEVEGDRAFAGVGELRLERHRRPAPQIRTREEWTAFRDSMRSVLETLLGEDVRLPRLPLESIVPEVREEGVLRIERTRCPSEGGILVPVTILRRRDATGPLPVTMLVGAAGRDSLLAEDGPGSARALAAAGDLVVIPDPRFVGDLSLERLAPEIGPELSAFRPSSLLGKPAEPAAMAAQVAGAWGRNSIVWGRPIAGMVVTDLRAVLDGVASRRDAGNRARIVARGAAAVAVPALLAAALDPRFLEVDVDLEGRSWTGRTLPPVPFILEHGDVLRWAALLADRRLTVRRPPDAPGELAELQAAFAAMGNAAGLEVGKPR